MVAGALSPSSSPRLPSPPPMAEDQTGSQSPTPAPSTLSAHSKLASVTSPAHSDNASAARRVRPGTKSIDMLDGPPLVPFSEIDSPFQLTEHLKSLHHHHTHPSPATTAPITRATAQLLATTPPGVEKALWLYELCRFLVGKANIFVVSLFADSPPCSSITCSEMRASEWQYLCAVHDPPKSCCAIDYCCHTLDWAGNTLTAPRNFPSRLVAGNPNHARAGSSDSSAQRNSSPSHSASSSASSSAQQQMRQLTNIFRRVYRIFAHAWFQHREVFWRVEGRTGLYTMFKTVCDVYQLIPEDNYTIPPEAEGLESADSDSPTADPIQPATAPASNGVQRTGSVIKDPPKPALTEPAPSSILRRGQPDQPEQPSGAAVDGAAAAAKLMTPGTSVTARRHKHSPSKGSPVATVVEENEEDEAAPKSPSRQGSQIKDARHAAVVAATPVVPPAASAQLNISPDASTLTSDTVEEASFPILQEPVIIEEPSNIAIVESHVEAAKSLSNVSAITNGDDEQAAPATAAEPSTAGIPLLRDPDGGAAETVAGIEAIRADGGVGSGEAMSSGGALIDEKPGENADDKQVSGAKVTTTVDSLGEDGVSTRTTGTT